MAKMLPQVSGNNAIVWGYIYGCPNHRVKTNSKGLPLVKMISQATGLPFQSIRQSLSSLKHRKLLRGARANWQKNAFAWYEALPAEIVSEGKTQRRIQNGRRPRAAKKASKSVKNARPTPRKKTANPKLAIEGIHLPPRASKTEASKADQVERLAKKLHALERREATLRRRRDALVGEIADCQDRQKKAVQEIADLYK